MPIDRKDFVEGKLYVCVEAYKPSGLFTEGGVYICTSKYDSLVLMKRPALIGNNGKLQYVSGLASKFELYNKNQSLEDLL